MSYSTGSGDYTALMSAVLAHAVADGWVEAGGVGTGWPISKGNVRGVDYSTFTVIEDDQTAGGIGGSKTQRYMRLGIGASPASATTDAVSTTTICPNMAYTFSEWHIFSDPSVNDHIHVVYKFSNGPNVDCYGHFSFGEINKGGLTYGSIAYVTAWGGRGYAVSGANWAGASDWNSINRCKNAWSGNVGEGDDGTALMTFNINAANSPIPSGVSGWPVVDTNYYDGDSLWGKSFRISADINGDVDVSGWDSQPSLNWYASAAVPPAQTGAITMMSIPFILTNSTTSSGVLRWAGTFPNVRKTSMNGVSPGDEITFGAEIWKVFPLLRNTPNSELNLAYKVTSGRAAIAFKKVV
jgi:hypothetical protein